MSIKPAPTIPPMCCPSAFSAKSPAICTFWASGALKLKVTVLSLFTIADSRSCATNKFCWADICSPQAAINAANIIFFIQFFKLKFIDSSSFCHCNNQTMIAVHLWRTVIRSFQNQVDGITGVGISRNSKSCICRSRVIYRYFAPICTG